MRRARRPAGTHAGALLAERDRVKVDRSPGVVTFSSSLLRIGVLAAAQAPETIGKLVLVGPSPRYIDDEGYTGGFGVEDIEELLVSMESNFLGWSSAMAPARATSMWRRAARMPLKVP